MITAAMRRAPRPPARYALAAGLLVLGVIGLTLPMGQDAPRGETYLPSPDAPRIGNAGRKLLGVQDVTDFDFWGDTLAVLDALGGRVAIFGPGDSVPVRSFGRRGSGPGEWTYPSSLARLHDGSIAVLDLPRLHLFGADSRFIRVREPRLPCRMNVGRIRADRSGTMLSGNCSGGPGAGDTLFAAVLFSSDLDDWRSLVKAPRLTIDGRWGSAFTAIEALGEGPDRHFFGIGMNDCVAVIDVREGSPPAVAERCGVAPVPYRGSAPTDFNTGSVVQRGPAFAWPDPLPRWLILASVDGEPVLGRPFSDDSITFKSPPPHDLADTADLLVADAEFVTCRRSRCLWRAIETDGVRIRLRDLMKRIPTEERSR